MFGRAVEGVYGKKEFLTFYLLAVVLGGVLWVAREYVMLHALAATEFGLGVGTEEFNTVLENSRLFGASGAVMAVTILFVCHFPRTTILLFFVIPVPAWVLAVFLIVPDVLRIFVGGGQIAFDVHLAGAAFAFLYWKFSWRLSPFLPGARVARPAQADLQAAPAAARPRPGASARGTTTATSTPKATASSTRLPGGRGQPDPAGAPHVGRLQPPHAAKAPVRRQPPKSKPEASARPNMFRVILAVAALLISSAAVCHAGEYRIVVKSAALEGAKATGRGWDIWRRAPRPVRRR